MNLYNTLLYELFKEIEVRDDPSIGISDQNLKYLSEIEGMCEILVNYMYHFTFVQEFLFPSFYKRQHSR